MFGNARRPKGFRVIPAGDRLMTIRRVWSDVRGEGLSTATAQDAYKVPLWSNGSVDGAETRRLKGAMADQPAP
jgi:hypothetical protein